jgi:LPXTG-motif cell wall-anchored protein
MNFSLDGFLSFAGGVLVASVFLFLIKRRRRQQQ